MIPPRLEDTTVRAYLARLGVASVPVNLTGLERLLRAHLLALPLHNLPGPGARERTPSLEAAVEGNLAGWGGDSASLTPPFLALLRSLGFEVWLTAAETGGEHGHPLGLVRLPEGRFAVDAGHAHPLPQPLPLDAGPSEFTAYGERFRVERTGAERFQLLRLSSPGRASPVYGFSLESCPCPVLPPTVEPRLETIQAMRASEWVLASIQDGHYHRIAGGLTTRRPIEDWEALATLLSTTFGLPREWLAQALAAARRNWRVPAGRARPPLRFLLSLAMTERLEGVSALLDSAAASLEREQRPPSSLGVLVLDNGRAGPPRQALDAVLDGARRRGLTAVRVEAGRELARLGPSVARGLLPPDLSPPLPIGAARALQASLLHEHLRTGRLGLPHPGDGRGPVAVWMLDDDLTFQRLALTPEGFTVEAAPAPFARAEALWREHPEVSVLLGSFTGEPPIPGHATFHVQTRDLAGNLRAMAERTAEAAWEPGPGARELPDYYYDHARGSTAHLDAVFPWIPPGRGPWRVRDAFTTLCAAFTRVTRGQQVTRPLLHVPTDTLLPSRNRGGNALFLDLDALVAAPYPVWRGEDGLLTRRADTLWAHLLAREPLSRLVQSDLDVKHGRWEDDGSSPLTASQLEPGALQRFVEGQERGVVLARLLEREGPVERAHAEREIAVRRELLARSRDGARQALAEAREVLLRESAWWWRDEPHGARVCLAALARLQELLPAVDALQDPRLPERLTDFARRLSETLPRWRDTWV